MALVHAYHAMKNHSFVCVAFSFTPVAAQCYISICSYAGAYTQTHRHRMIPCMCVVCAAAAAAVQSLSPSRSLCLQRCCFRFDTIWYVFQKLIQHTRHQYTHAHIHCNETAHSPGQTRAIHIYRPRTWWMDFLSPYNASLFALYACSGGSYAADSIRVYIAWCYMAVIRSWSCISNHTHT